MALCDNALGALVDLNSESRAESKARRQGEAPLEAVRSLPCSFAGFDEAILSFYADGLMISGWPNIIGD
ncbi:hypothetical protein [Saccharopolyspora sp. NPDC049426]|uniref:hypothetical protein n=1 Tax=Saccharopolyspora sp. NPDC049426 TaxID=3155652 RepID=UPI0034309823